MKKVIAVLCLMLMAAGCASMSLSEWLTPGEVDSDAVKYVVEAGVAKPEEYDGYGNLYKAVKLRKDVEISHKFNIQDIEHLAEEENLVYSVYSDTTSTNAIVAQQREEAIFGEEGLLSLGLTIAGFGGLTGLLGLMRKRPGDMTKEDYENALATTNGKTVAELSLKEKQFCQLVKGVQSFLDSSTVNPLPAKQLKEALSKTTDEDTRKAVAVAKAIL